MNLMLKEERPLRFRRLDLGMRGLEEVESCWPVAINRSMSPVLTAGQQNQITVPLRKTAQS